MNRFYQTELAGARFYNAFYRELFRRYNNFDELDASWRQRKKEVADWIAGIMQ